MKITIDIDAERQELESIVRMLLNGPLTEADIAKAEQREILRQQAECKERVSAIFHKSINDQRKKALRKAESKSHS